MRAHQLTLSAALACAAGAPATTLAEDITMVQQATPRPTRLPIEGELPSLDGASEWLNSPPLTPADLRGKVVLVDFWTYTCINWLRTLPYVRAWAEKYKDQGLVVIGVHTPEFAFEHDIDNVRRAAKEHAGSSIRSPIDNDYAHLACLRQPLLAGALLRRRAGAYSVSSLRRGRLRRVGTGHPTVAGRGRQRRHRPWTWWRSMRVVPKRPPIGAACKSAGELRRL